jgi:hypothetical protein
MYIFRGKGAIWDETNELDASALTKDTDITRYC